MHVSPQYEMGFRTNTRRTVRSMRLMKARRMRDDLLYELQQVLPITRAELETIAERKPGWQELYFKSRNGLSKNASGRLDELVRLTTLVLREEAKELERQRVRAALSNHGQGHKS